MNNWDAQLYNTKHAFVSQYGLDVVAFLDPQPGESILDLGCGTGTLTDEIARHGASVMGIDSSSSMIEKAKGSFPQIEFMVADGQDFHLPVKFDAVFSNAALHWMKSPEKVIACIWESLKKGGRFVAEFGGKGNVEKIIHYISQARKVKEQDLINYFPSIGEYSSLLEAQGFQVTMAFHFDRLTPLSDGENGLRNWVKMFRGSVLSKLTSEEQERLLSRIEEIAKNDLYNDGIWHADYKRIRIKAIK